ncbi:hypothetical protein CCP3SC1_390013 [Gammaproteobacteria bacterium]
MRLRCPAELGRGFPIRSIVDVRGIFVERTKLTQLQPHVRGDGNFV